MGGGARGGTSFYADHQHPWLQPHNLLWGLGVALQSYPKPNGDGQAFLFPHYCHWIWTAPEWVSRRLPAAEAISVGAHCCRPSADHFPSSWAGRSSLKEKPGGTPLWGRKHFSHYPSTFFWLLY